MKKTLLFILALTGIQNMIAAGEWYSQGDFYPQARLEFTLINDLDIERTNYPMVIKRENFPLPDLHEMRITIVDPTLPPYEGPSEELLAVQGGHQLRTEKNGAALFHQLDDIDKDGIWDELVFQVTLKPNEIRTIYIYLGENIRGWNKHKTHANIGSYCRHSMPFWESEHVGWKIWFSNSVDVYGKRKPVLISQILYMENIDGYGVAHLNRDYGSDIQSVAHTFGGGSICLFEHPEFPDSVSRPRFTPKHAELVPESLWNAGQLSDTRNACDVVVNGPIRSMVKIKTMNWDSGNGFYELEQYYSVYADQSYTTCKVSYTTYNPKKAGVLMGCGIRKKPGEEILVKEGGLIISSGPEAIRDPEHIDDRQDVEVDFIGKAILVKDEYKPTYKYVMAWDGNHVLSVVPDENKSYEYMLFAAWSEGAVLNNAAEFEAYVRKTALEYENPVQYEFVRKETKD